MAPPVFDGENYQACAVKMAAYMEGCDLWETVENDYEVAPLPENPTMNQIKYHKERTTRKAKAKSCLFATVSPTIFTRIMRYGSAKAIWDFLKSEYEGDERVRGMKVLNLLREFERQQMDDAETVKEYAKRLIEIVDKIRVLGTDIKDDRIVQKILISLPEKFEATIASLENTKDLSEIKLAELLSALQAQEQRRMIRRGEPKEGALQAKLQLNAVGKGKKWSQRKGDGEGFKSVARSKGSSTQDQSKKGKQTTCKHCGKTNHPHYRCWRRPDVKCRKCHKMGHIDRFCKEKSTQQQNEAQVAQEDEHLFVASCYASSTAGSG
ncbi:uncharacterized protein LOC116193951 [Punica granatum]|uniref:Uncharacterized protein LOC116193951 n=1 Tax=Punica granatum TaxID=22663 RepID=A0A6P8C7X3_PUNGR|nr:uncharacterized protein LOC116193951 [Punica granatum]